MDLSTRARLCRAEHASLLYTQWDSMQAAASMVDLSLVCSTGQVVRCHKAQ